ncbi:MAG: hypothetical protein JO094_15295 [Hyphomicrobiales bacterium]|nr:hypothetical protein [Hyphomicrobiales bacterium]MBV9053831.1 hypothetical protein [Hyphomicrobiales bacterium]MBV9591183.1 hypothetical protein [Hyphomicrobiales bacterium]MBV9974870.1 hypothetical protein [Hyphomicrobiales bacterium]
MTNLFFEAVVDTILPGEDEASCAASPLPSGSQAGVTLEPRNAEEDAVLRLIAERAGGEEAFRRASLAAQTAVLANVEKERFEIFRAIVSNLLQHYYEAPIVLAAMGWREGAAQPLGHKIPEADEATLKRLEAVRARGAIWRPAS